ncbi:hypothetical protein SK128_005857 [Halocaridina rubra]|uniref:Uncharacterized protein n=1 Tax=Halocaridina rubra TaxID=373956 RepID=A0AAN8X700_HALRR
MQAICSTNHIENGVQMYTSPTQAMDSQKEREFSSPNCTDSQHSTLQTVRRIFAKAPSVFSITNGTCLKSHKKEELHQKCEPERTDCKSDEAIVPDGGWGWVVIFGASLIAIIVDTIGQSFGFLFWEFFLHLDTSAIITTSIFNLFEFIYCLTTLFLNPLLKTFGYRKPALIGAILFAVGTISSAFQTSPYGLFVTYSVCAGVGSGILAGTYYLIAPQYFKRWKGLANGIIMASDCGGSLFGAHVINFLQDEYGYNGATLILGGIALNCCIGASLFHPVEWHIKVPKVLKENGARNASAHREKVEFPHKSAPATGEQLYTLLQIIKSAFSSLLILESKKAVIIALTTTLSFNSYMNFIALAPFFMQEAGYSLKDTATCLTVASVCNITSRLSVAACSDSRYFSYRLTLMTCNFLITVCMIRK